MQLKRLLTTILLWRYTTIRGYHSWRYNFKGRNNLVKAKIYSNRGMVHSVVKKLRNVSHQNATWDQEQGVWSNIPLSIDDLPDPLYVFGYGSLIWRPGDLLGQFPAYPATAIGYKRLFAQRSCDHRGTSKFPGVVLNIVEDEVLLRRGYDINVIDSLDNYRCQGMVWLIPREQALTVISELDFRERGGYLRHVMDVELHADTEHHHKDDIAQCIVYVASEINPNFFLPNMGNESQQPLHVIEDPYYLQRVNPVVDIISTSRGVSGPNIEYLFKLVEYLSARDMEDKYLIDLSRAVRLRIGPWRNRLYYKANRRDIKEKKSLQHEWKQNQLAGLPQNYTNNHQLSIFQCSLTKENHWHDYEDFYLLNNRYETSIISDKSVFLSGDIVNKISSKLFESNPVDQNSSYPQYLHFDGVERVVSSNDLLMLITNEGFIVLLNSQLKDQSGEIQHQLVLQAKDYSWEIHRKDNQITLKLLVSPVNKNELQSRVVKCVISEYYSAIALDCGSLLIIYNNQLISRRLANDRKIIDLTATAGNIFILDEEGSIHYCNFNDLTASEDATSSSSSFSFHEVESPKSIRFLRITCTENILVARGVQLDGTPVCYYWRIGHYHKPNLLPPPTIEEGIDTTIGEIWCGPNYLVVATKDESLWISSLTDEDTLRWQRVLVGEEQQQVRVYYIWEGAVSCERDRIYIISKSIV